MRNFGLVLSPIGSLLVMLHASLPAQSLTRNPSIWETDASSFLVAFKTSANVLGAVEWGPTAALGNTATGTSTSTHAIRITGLQPDHFYWYRVLLGGTAATPVYRTRTYPSSTSPTASDVSFFVFGDSGVGSSDQTRVANLVQSYDWDLGILPGDIVYGSGQASGFDPYFFSIYAATLRTTPFYPALGNHDVSTSNGQPYLDAFYLPTANSGTERWYSFDHGKVHFIALDSNNVSSAQTAWLRSDLTAARANNVQWIFVHFHHPGYNSGTHHGREQSVYQNWCPVFEEFEVDAVFQGHEHIYERTSVRRDFFPNKRGVVYYVVGTGGNSLYGYSAQSYSAYGLVHHGALKVDVRGNVYHSVFLDGESSTLGQLMDPFTMTRGTPTPALNETGPSPQPGQSFQGTFGAANGAYYALYASLQPVYTPDPVLGLILIGSPGTLLTNGYMGSSQSAPFSLAVPNQSALVGTSIYFQGITVSGPTMDLRLTDVLCGRVR